MKNFLTKKSIINLLLSLIAAGGLFTGAYFYVQYQKTQQVLKNPTLASQMEAQSLIDRVGKLIDLPNQEQPTIATVTDYTKLKDQPFFRNARNGFKVLIYTKARKAILYDPFHNKIVEVAPVNIGQATSPSPSTAPISVALYNGTSTSGLTNTIEQELKSKVNNLSIVSKSNAKKSDYTKTLVIDLTGKQSTASSQLASLLDGQVANLPSGELKAPGADILIIIGSSK